MMKRQSQGAVVLGKSKPFGSLRGGVKKWVGIAWSGLGVEMRRKGRLGQSVRGKPQMGFGFKDDKRGAFDQRIQLFQGNELG